jgi:phenylacetate-CoA ligase
MTIWNKKFECIPPRELEQLQLERLQSTINRVSRNVVFYQKLFKEAGIVPEDIKSLTDLRRIPLTDRATLTRAYPYDMFAVPLREVVRLQTSSGTTRSPIVVGYTRNDVIHWTELVARVLTGAGISRDDVIQISFDYGLFPGALGMHYGAEAVGASVIPASTAGPDRQIAVMKDFRSTVLIAAPGYALRLANMIREMNINPQELSLRIGFFGAETWSENLRHDLEERLRIKAYDFYGLSELFNPGVAGECEAQNGLHIFEDHFIPEIIDPVSGQLLSYGEEGELVLTSITKEAFPLIRYRTGDITTLIRDECSCGRTMVRMARIKGRTDDMFSVRGVSIFPSQIEEILTRIEGTEPHFQLRIDREDEQEVVRLLVEISSEIFSDEMKKLQSLRREIEAEVYQLLGLEVEVKIVESRALSSREEGMRRVIDNRNGGEL